MSAARVPPGGLCPTCAHVRRIESDRGSVFLLCGQAAGDPRFRRYPPQPVVLCPGHVEGPSGAPPTPLGETPGEPPEAAPGDEPG